MKACHKRCLCSFFLLQLVLLPSLISSSSSETLQGSDSRNQILAASATTNNDVFSGKESDASYYNVGGRKMRGVTTVNNMGADEDMEKICKEGAVKVGVRESKKQYRGGDKDSKVVEEEGFVAFSADYRTPRHHPPKNN